MLAIRGHFDGKVFVPDEPVSGSLPVDQPLVLRVEVVEKVPKSAPPGDFWDALEKYSGSISAPADWSAEHDHYLYGTPKRSSQQPEETGP